MQTDRQRPVSTTTSQIKLLHSLSRTCSELTECRTTGRGVYVCVYITDALWSHKVKVRGQCFGDLALHYHLHLAAALYIHSDVNSKDALRVYVNVYTLPTYSVCSVFCPTRRSLWTLTRFYKHVWWAINYSVLYTLYFYFLDFCHDIRCFLVRNV